MYILITLLVILSLLVAIAAKTIKIIQSQEN